MQGETSTILLYMQITNTPLLLRVDRILRIKAYRITAALQNNICTRNNTLHPFSLFELSSSQPPELPFIQHWHSCFACHFTNWNCMLFLHRTKNTVCQGEFLVVLRNLFSLTPEKNLNCRTDFHDWCLYYTNFPLDSTWDIGLRSDL